MELESLDTELTMSISHKGAIKLLFSQDVRARKLAQTLVNSYEGGLPLNDRWYKLPILNRSFFTAAEFCNINLSSSIGS